MRLKRKPRRLRGAGAMLAVGIAAAGLGNLPKGDQAPPVVKIEQAVERVERAIEPDPLPPCPAGAIPVEPEPTKPNPTGMVLAGELNVRAAPSGNARIVTQVFGRNERMGNAGDELEITDRQFNGPTEWLRIKTRDGRDGWVSARFVSVTAERPEIVPAPPPFPFPLFSPRPIGQ